MRAVVPYSAELTRSLQADNTYIYFAIALTLLLGIVLYLDTALQLHDKGITPSLQVPQHIEVLGDASLIYSIFRNLIDNAISYATGASRLAIVCKETESEGRHFYEFLVSDNGPGVAFSESEPSRHPTGAPRSPCSDRRQSPVTTGPYYGFRHKGNHKVS